MKVVTVDGAELLRFVLVGVTATIGNLTAVRLARSAVPFETALLVGMAAGLIISFLMSKSFAFRSRSWSRAPGEMMRFLLVYAVSCTLYWTVAVVVGRAATGWRIGPSIAETLGILIGAGAMMVTSYLGHRFFTYRTPWRKAEGLDAS